MGPSLAPGRARKAMTSKVKRRAPAPSLFDLPGHGLRARPARSCGQQRARRPSIFEVERHNARRSGARRSLCRRVERTGRGQALFRHRRALGAGRAAPDGAREARGYGALTKLILAAPGKERQARGHSLSRRPDRPPPRRRCDVPLGDAARRQRDCARERARVSHRRRRRADPGRPSVRCSRRRRLLQPPSHQRTNPMPFITAKDGAQLYWHEWGAGAPILFLNGLGCGSRMWDYQMAAFADEGFRCIGFDRRGHGRSDQPASGYDFDTFADDVAALVDDLDLSEPHPHRPFDGGRRGGAVSRPGTGANASRASSSSRRRRRCCSRRMTIQTACRWKPSRLYGRGGGVTIRNGSPTMSRRSSSPRPRPR